MPPKYQIKPLSPDSTARAYPLIQAAWPDVSLDAWIEYVEKLCSSREAASETSGIMAAENPHGYIHGLFCYIVHVALNHSSVLNIDNFIALDTGDRAAATEALLKSMDDLAQNLQCSAIHTHIPNGWINLYSNGGGLVDRLQSSGHDLAFVKFCKSVGNVRTLR